MFFSRSYYVARSYSNVKKWKETVALYQRALDNCKKAVTGLKKQPQNDKLKVCTTLSDFEPTCNVPHFNSFC